MTKELLAQTLQVGISASECILQYYGETQYTTKEDQTPLTQADLHSHKLIIERLSHMSSFPINSEESPIPYRDRKNAATLWLVDPLDGTKDFLARNGGFTVNIALVSQGRPILGVVTAPAQKIAFFALKGMGAFKLSSDLWHSVLGGDSGGVFTHRLSGESTHKRDPLLACVSNFHDTPQTQDFIDHFKLSTQKMGSSLKICALAEGVADLYPRLNGTKEWDTAASEIILEEAGGEILSLEKCPLVYNKQNLSNPHFVAFSRGQVNGDIYREFREHYAT